MDSRFCVTMSITESGNVNLDWKYQDMSYQQIREVCKRITTSLRVSDTGKLVAIERVHLESEPSKICVAFLAPFGAIQAALTNISDFDACIMLDEVIWQINHEIVGQGYATTGEY